MSKFVCFYLYKWFYFSIIILVWLVYRHTFIAGGNGFNNYWKRMNMKFKKTIGSLRKLQRQKIIPVSVSAINEV